MANEVGQQPAAVGRVHDLGVEHQAVEAALLVGGDGIGRAFGACDDREAFGKLLDAVAMAHPDLVALAFGPQSVEQRRAAGDFDEGAAELAVVRGRDHAAKLVRHHLLAVADAEHRNAGLENMLRRAGAILPHHRGGAAGEDHALRLQSLEGFGG